MTETTNPRIASVTVAFNSAARIVEHLQTLVAQTTPITEIIVVDNASTDDTVAIVTRQFPAVKVLQTGANLGVGAYSVGMEYACKQGHDWVWTLDDDSRPLPTALTELLAGYEAVVKDGKVGLIAPLAINASTGRPYPLWLWRNRQVRVPVDETSPDFLDVDMTISSGSLVAREAIEVVGLPRVDYFMDWLDFEYCLRLRQAAFRVVIARRCTMPHSIGKHQCNGVAGLKLERQIHPPFHEYYKTRNVAHFVWNQRPHPLAKAFVLRQFAEHVAGTILFDSQKLCRLRMMYSGLKDGVRGRLGFRFGPEQSRTTSSTKDKVAACR